MFLLFFLFEILCLVISGTTENSIFVKELIHEADPQSRPLVIIVFAYVVRTYVRPYVRLHFSKPNKFQAKTMSATGEVVGWPSGSLMAPVLYCLVFLVAG